MPHLSEKDHVGMASNVRTSISTLGKKLGISYAQTLPIDHAHFFRLSQSDVLFIEALVGYTLSDKQVLKLKDCASDAFYDERERIKTALK